jgi:predicted RNA-binding protein YlxR (DUF448 family)
LSAFSRKRPAPRAGSWRTCAGCGRRLPRREVLRLVRGADGGCQLDMERRRGGRGLNLCCHPDCWLKAEQRGAAARRLGARLQAELLRQQLTRWLEGEFHRLWRACLEGGFLLAGRPEVDQAAAAGRAALLLLRDVEGSGGCSFVPYRRVPQRLWGERAKVDIVAVTHRGLARRLRRLLDICSKCGLAGTSLAGREGGFAVDMAADGGDYAVVRDRCER